MQSPMQISENSPPSGDLDNQDSSIILFSSLHIGSRVTSRESEGLEKAYKLFNVFALEN